MILKLLVSGLILAGGFFAVNVPAPQDEKDAAKKMQEMKEMMEKYQKSAVPTEIHQGLAKLAGKWNQNQKMMMPGTPAIETKGTCEFKSILGGRFVIGDVKAEMPGLDGKMQPFEGLWVLGYDNVTKQFQSVWCDTTSTAIWHSAGTADASGKVITLDGTAKDIITPEGRAFRMVMKIEGDDKHVLEWHDTYEGKLTKMGEITDTRVK